MSHVYVIRWDLCFPASSRQVGRLLRIVRLHLGMGALQEMPTTDYQHSDSGHDLQHGSVSKVISNKFGRHNALACFALALLVTLVAATLTMLFPVISRPYYFFVGAIALATWYGGWKPGVLSGVLSAVLAIFASSCPLNPALQEQ